MKAHIENTTKTIQVPTKNIILELDEDEADLLCWLLRFDITVPLTICKTGGGEKYAYDNISNFMTNLNYKIRRAT